MIPIIKMLTVDEGFRDVAYKDTVGKTTVGIGFNMDDVNAHTIWQYAGVTENFDLVRNKTVHLSKESAWKLVNVCVDNCKIDLRHLINNFDNLPEGVRLALINLMYNMGNSVFSQFKQFIGIINSGNYVSAAIDLGNTKWAKEVPNRAERVMELINEDDSGYGRF